MTGKAKNITYFILVLGIFIAGTVYGETAVASLSDRISTIAEANNNKNDKNDKDNKDKKDNAKGNNNDKKKDNDKKDKEKKEHEDRERKAREERERRERDARNPKKAVIQKPVVIVQPGEKQVIENNNTIENNVENSQNVTVGRGNDDSEEVVEVVTVTEEGTPVYVADESISTTPETGVEVLSLLALLPGSIAGYIIRKKSLLN